MKRTLLTLALVLAMLTPGSAAGRKDIHPVYVCEGTSAEGKAYKTLLEVVKGEQGILVRWSFFNGDAPSYGVGFVEGNRFNVAFAAGALLGVVVYKIDAKSLKGSWVDNGTDRVLRETCHVAPEGHSVPTPTPKAPHGPATETHTA